jgi:hypothetical protein
MVRAPANRSVAFNNSRLIAPRRETKKTETKGPKDTGKLHDMIDITVTIDNMTPDYPVVNHQDGQFGRHEIEIGGGCADFRERDEMPQHQIPCMSGDLSKNQTTIWQP